MSFTDGKRRVATEADLAMSWCGEKNGKRFRCYLCGHRFRAGDGWRWQYAGCRNFVNPETGKTFGVSNFFVCDGCDGDDVLDRWVQRNIEFCSPRFWALR